MVGGLLGGLLFDPIDIILLGPGKPSAVWSRLIGFAVIGLSVAAVALAGLLLVANSVILAMLDRRYEIGLRKSLGASDHEILIQFLLEAVVLAAIGALIGTVAGATLCQALSSKFPYGLVVNPLGLLSGWVVALVLALAFGLYPALRAARLSPMEAMR